MEKSELMEWKLAELGEWDNTKRVREYYGYNCSNCGYFATVKEVNGNGVFPRKCLECNRVDKYQLKKGE